MGHDVHITRKTEWSANEGAEISLQEWLDVVESDEEFRLDGFAEATTTGGETLRIESDGIAVWTAYSGDGVGGNMAWFCYSGGEVVVKNPDEEMLGKMCRVADRLGAHVQGDDGERYDVSTESAGRASKKGKWWKRR